MAMPCQGRPGPWQGFALAGRFPGNALPRLALPLARHCQASRARGKALPRPAGPLAKHCHERPGPRQHLAKADRALGKVLPRPAWPVAMPCQGRPAPGNALAKAPGPSARHCRGQRRRRGIERSAQFNHKMQTHICKQKVKHHKNPKTRKTPKPKTAPNTGKPKQTHKTQTPNKDEPTMHSHTNTHI